MTRKSPLNRRAFMKKAAVTAGVTGSVIGTAQPVAAADQELIVYGYDYGEYTIYVNDSNAYGGSDLESDDGVDNTTSKSRFKGTVTAGDTDTYHFTGQVTDLVLYGDLDVSVNNPNGMNRYGDMTVKGTDTPYSIRVTDSLAKTNDCESNDKVNGDTVNGQLDGSDTDTYNVDGTIEYATVIPGSYVTITHDL